MAFKVNGGQTFVFIGDSITDCGRRAHARPLGDGYVRQVVDMATARYPERKIDFINEGISGNTVIDLRNRWSDDVLRHRPHWLSVKIGINDLHQNLGGGPITPAVFETTYRDILTQARKHCNPRIVLIDPFYISADRWPASFRTSVLKALPKYIAVVHKMAREFKAASVRTHDLFQQQLRHRPADAFCPEPVHPTASGHLVIAHGVLKALGW
ncbi:MAG: SGNH/GDSL hydrolase family protein [Planctomycetaceae bacterium]|nr:SGNH/GDSL hydrolase family protein [Planctomycetaceae bacterium]